MLLESRNGFLHLKLVNFRYLVPVLLLIGTAVYLVIRGVDDINEAKTDIGSADGSSRPGSGFGRTRGKDEKAGLVRSKRILRDRRSPITTPSGLQYEVLQEGAGSRPGPTSKVKVHYVGTLGGLVFDSSRERGQPATFPLNQVIKGWTEGLQLMKEGATYRFEIPSDLAYGERGAFGNATLTFEVELIEVVDP